MNADILDLYDFIISEKNLAEEFVQTVQEEDVIVLWGAGKALYWYMRFFEMKEIHPSLIIDKNASLCGKVLYGCKIEPPDYIIGIEDIENIKIVITTPRYKKEVTQEIQKLYGNVKIYSFEAEIYFTFLRNMKQYREYLTSNINNLALLYEELNDDKSKQTLIAFIKGRVSANQDYFSEVMVENQYFPQDIVVLNDREVIVEAGSNDGSTLKNILEVTKGKFERIYCFEPDLICIPLLEEIINKEKNISLITKGVGAIGGEVKFKTDALSGGSRVVTSGEYDYKIDITTIDEEVKQCVSMIKMDIEGLELEALKGCKRILTEDAPKLAICVYHRAQDIIEIWQYLKRIQPQYKFYLRHHNWGATETVLYAIADEAR